MKRIGLILILYSIPFIVYAQNWDYIKSSGEYYYGESMATSEAEADKEALAQLVSMIAVHVSSDFSQSYEQISNCSEMNYNQYVPESVINTYGLPSPTLLNDEITEELSHQKIIVDKK